MQKVIMIFYSMVTVVLLGDVQGVKEKEDEKKELRVRKRYKRERADKQKCNKAERLQILCEKLQKSNVGLEV